MGKASAVSKRRKKAKSQKFVRKSKIRKQRDRQLVKKKSIKIECAPIRQSWDPKKSLNENMSSMGLSVDPNKTLKIENESVIPKKKKSKKPVSKANSQVIEELETMAAKPVDKKFKFGLETSKFCVYMIEKYGDDYKAMARDKQNYYQESVGQIRQKINKFKSIPSNWNSYLKAKDIAEDMQTTE